MVPSGNDLEASRISANGIVWGAFQPGNVAAFYYEVPPEGARKASALSGPLIRALIWGEHLLFLLPPLTEAE